MTNSYRIERVSGVLKREIAVILQKEFKDPRVKMVTISDVIVKKDLSNATVFFLVIEDNATEVENVLNSATGFFRSKLASSVTLRTVPKLKFKYDASSAQGRKIEDILDKL